MGLDIRRKFGKKIYKLRTQRGWTQEDLAEHADIAVRHVQRLESNAPSPVKIDTNVGVVAKRWSCVGSKKSWRQ